MRNPFLHNGYLLPNTSLNKLKVVEIPMEGSYEELQNKTAYDIFSTSFFISEIKMASKELRLDIDALEEGSLPFQLEKCFESEDKTVRETAEKIGKHFGERLGIILLTLKKGEEENRKAREDWTEEHWNYWKYIKTIILVGGLASGRLGEKLKFYAEDLFRKAHEEGYEIILVKDSSNMAIRGCASYIEDKNSNSLVFDFGQSFVKRSLVHIDGSKEMKVMSLSKIPAYEAYSEANNETSDRRQAEKLNQYIVNLICRTCQEVKASKLQLSSNIVMSIANYVMEGRLQQNRGTYGKLSLLADNYEEYLSQQLSHKLNGKIQVKLVHDGTAAARAFSQYERAACISLGTAFGVGFPDGGKQKTVRFY